MMNILGPFLPTLSRGRARFSETTAVMMIAAVVGACSSNGKVISPESSRPSGQATKDQVGASSEPQAETVRTPETVESEETGGRKYAGLSRAVRSGQGAQVISEAASLLGRNAYDATALNALGLYYLNLGRIPAAKAYFNKALEKNTGYAALYNNLGVALQREGDLAAAIVNFKKALRVDDRNAASLGNLGSVYLIGGDYAKARFLLEQSYKLNPNQLSVANNYAISLRVAKEFRAAQRVYDQVLSKDSKNVDALLNYATLLIEHLNQPKDGLNLVYKVKFLETDRQDVLAQANALEKKAKAELK